MTDASTAETRAGFAAIVGRPNVGKSTLLNALLGAKLAIVSPRPQTTRNRILGVHTADAHQTVFVDTPGIHRGGGDLNRFMVREALASLDGVDCVILVTETLPAELRDATKADPAALLHADDRFVLEQILGRPVAEVAPANAAAEDPSSPSAKLVIALNKIDLIRDRRQLLPLLAAWNAAGFSRLVPISARGGDGIDRLLGEVHALLPTGPHLYPEDMLTDRAERFLAAELIREQVFLRCRQELPYAVAVEIDAFRERPEREDVVVEATVHVERESQKAILVGKAGSMIKAIGTTARDEIAGLLGCTVHLKLTVRVAQEWTRRPSARRRFGYE